VPPPFRVSSAQPDPATPLPELVSTGHFRSAAIKAAQLLTTPGVNTADHDFIFACLYTRFSCLTLCNQTALAAQEVKALEDLNSSYYRDDVSGSHLVPWELRVLAVRLQGMGFNDARRGVMGYYDLAREARLLLTSLKKTRIAKEEKDESVEEEIKLWEGRLAELGIRVASALIEMEDLEGATRFLSTLKPSSSATPDANLKLEMQKALLWLCLGDVDAARACLSRAVEGDQQEKQVILALAYMADSDFENAVKVWEELISGADAGGEMAMWKQNLGVCYLYLGRMDSVRIFLGNFPASNIQ
jgi:tetratricopeptide (TPR) repeat protein